ncbi:hypothetical protein DXV75_13330 [Alteromonas aestuariivivens]|uniref:Uncharacterized protein n=1 Tax=Alteromonas aestuariivivens TaxID=1938339 RepID=A0A3D8M4J7_9ALTE|nr:hypothetical protein [Alteromonas aestuariivivens]RDV24663.1 hypothetical protein DXV75_13330 [Alteromonas aestuariivivens]
MSNDLLFSVLPRQGKVPVRTPDKVRKVSKEKNASGLGEEEQQEHGEERLVSEQEQIRRMEQHSENGHRSPGEKRAERCNSETSEKAESPEDTQPPHLDIFI